MYQGAALQQVVELLIGHQLLAGGVGRADGDEIKGTAREAAQLLRPRQEVLRALRARNKGAQAAS